MKLLEKYDWPKKDNILKILMGSMFLIALLLILTPIARADSSYTDPIDDIRCFTEEDIEDLEGYFGDEGELDDPSDFVDIVLDLWDSGTISATPNCIDMTLITLEDVWGDRVKLTITVEGAFSDCPFAMFLIWGNCSDNDYLAIITIATNEGGGTTAHYGYVNEDGDNDSGNADMNSDMDEVSMTYPRPDGSCSLFIMSVATDESHELLCIDLFPNSLYEPNPFNPSDPNNPFNNEPTGGQYYNGWCPLTNLVDNLAQYMFGLIMCGRLAFLLISAISVVIFKILIDRKNNVVKGLGAIGDGFMVWILAMYALDINLATPDPVLDFSLLALIDLLSCIFLLVFVAYSYLNQFKWVNDGEWSWVLAYAFTLINTALFFSPWWYYECSGSAFLTLVIQIIALIPCVIALFLTEKYSKGRLP